MAQFGLGGSLRAGAAISNSQGGDMPLSKVVELDGNYRIFFSTFMSEIEVKDQDTGEVVETITEGDIRAAVVPGRTGDYEKIGTGFIPYTSDMYEIDPITDHIVDLTPLEDWGRIARVIFEAECIREKKNAEAEAERSAKELGKPIDPIALSKSLEGIEQKYHGGTAQDGETQVMPSVSPMLSTNIQLKISTRVLVVRLSADDTPDWKNAKYAVYEISKTRMQDLIGMLNNKKYFRGEYLEVGYNYTGPNRKEAGKNAKFLPIVKSESLEETFPALWKAQGKAKVDQICQGDTGEKQVQFMRSRNRSFRGTVSPKDAISAMRKWCSTNQAVFGSIDFADDSVARAATLFLENHLVDDLPFALAEFKRLADENAKGNTDEEDNATEETTEQAGPTIEDMEVAQARQAASTQVDESAVAKAMSQFASGAVDSQNLRAVQDAGNIDISAGDMGDLGDL